MEDRFGRLGRQTLVLAAQRVVSAVFPDDCVGCGMEGQALCADCRVSLSGRMAAVFVCPGCGLAVPQGGRCGRHGCDSSALDGLTYLGAYGERGLNRLLRRWKYESAESDGQEFLKVCRDAWRASVLRLKIELSGASAVPVPLHPFRLSRRGFNQAARLSHALADDFGLVFRPDILVRRFSFKHQASGKMEERADLSKSSFAVRSGVKIPQICLLVDDVVTSGSTLAICARVLKQAGCRRVLALCALRGGPKLR